ncbi:dihydrofolate reductase [Streptomyces piniterrae]|uniref:Dihydrofolate reductase n=1 Tax=Streptomyces piniterrae TaxID=2571125 RepID=A0A4U0NFW9_9ACTN|nr:dihydrofolate reductase family protein [Streptomyces piniterrae]TJZ53027.1 dihydrofolate reductase [Streptomyces piniterrae]
MSHVFADISMSLDGYITGPNPGVGNGLGDHGERLHQWLFGLASWRRMHGLQGGTGGRDSELLDEAFERAGSFVMGRRMFDIAEEPWGDEPPFHGPVFVVTHRPHPPLVKQGGTTFHFITEGPEDAVRRATEAAAGKDVSVAGGADVIRQLLTADLLDELQIHLVPVLLGGGLRLFDSLPPGLRELDTTRVVASPGVTHVRLRPAK